MYIPAAFREEDLAVLHDIMRAVRLATLVTATSEGLLATPLPLLLVPEEGPYGTLYGHLARANTQWRQTPLMEAMVIFMAENAYVSPNYYPSKQEHHKVVPTWNYVTVQAYGQASFFSDTEELLNIVTKLTDYHERTQAQPWAVADAPADFIQAQLKAITGFKLPISRLEGKRKLSQNRPVQDRQGVVAGLAQSARESDQDIARLIPL